MRIVRLVFLIAISSAYLVFPLSAGPVEFDDRWREQGFLRLWKNEYLLSGRQLDVSSDGTVSLIWRPVDADDRGSKSASWRWRVTQGVKPTDLGRKGGDDRNLALYFVFVDEQSAGSVNVRSARKLLQDPAAHALVYVWGGAHRKRSILKSPYHPRLRTVVQRTDQTGTFSERVDLARDYQAAFGSKAGVLVGVAVSADSDDTDGNIRAAVADLRLE